MESLRVDICYRPLRIGWVIRDGDLEALRSAVRLSFCFWGGRFNPIIVADRVESASEIVDLFRVDLIIPVGDSDVVKSFPDRFPHLRNPLFPPMLFFNDAPYEARAQILDVHNALVHLRSSPNGEVLRKKSVRLYSWANDDPLADLFLLHFGQYPGSSEIQIDYRDIAKQGIGAVEVNIESGSPLSADLLETTRVFPFWRGMVWNDTIALPQNGIRQDFSTET